MTKFSLLSQNWQLKLVGGVASIGTFLTAAGECAFAQVVPDNTLGSEGSVITPNVNIRSIPSERIDGGAVRGANLFHSFEQLDVLEGRGVYFTNPDGIVNILSRVTGENRSSILGRLGVLGNANLFVINPNGIIFGPNASLDVRGSFVATTADAIKLGDRGLFSASRPGSSNLLTINPSALWFNAIAPQPIVNQSQAESAFGQPNVNDGPTGLQVPPGRTLALVGGSVLLEGGNLTATGGRMELGSVAGVGEVSLRQTGNSLVLGYDSVSEFGNISLSGEAFMDASGEGGGDVQIQGARLEMTQGTAIRADTVGAGEGRTVRVRTTDAVVLSEDSLITADVTSTGTGNGGNLTIDTRRLRLRTGAQVAARTSGEGDGGSVQINASQVEVIGISADGPFPSGLFTRSNRMARGDAGELRINTRRLVVSGGALVSASTLGAGNGGSLQIQASEIVEVIGTTPEGLASSGLFAQSQGSGEAGDLSLNTERLLVRDGAQVVVGTRGSGNGGNLQIIASDSVEVIGESADGRIGSGLFASSQGSGNAGNLSLNTGRLLVSDGAQVTAATGAEGDGGSLQITASEAIELIGTSADGFFPSGLFTQSRGSGNAGDLMISNTGRLLVLDGAVVSASAFGEGNGGSLIIQVSDSIEVIGASADNQRASGLLTRAVGNGNAGDLSIDTGRLLVRDGSQVLADTGADGDGGNLQINASDSVEVIGISADRQFSSNVSTQTEGRGNAGDLSINTGQLLVRDGAQVSTGTRADGDGGNLQINASNSVEVIGESADGEISSVLIAASRGSGNAGDLNLDTERLLVRDGAGLLVSSSDTNAGDLTITTPLLVLLDRGRLSAGSGGIDGGNVILRDLTLLVLRQGGLVTARSENAANGGNIIISADEGFVVSVPEENSDIIANAEQGNGGNIAITARGVFGLTVNPLPILLPASEINASSEAGVDGTVVISDPNVNLQTATSLPETFREPSLVQGCEASVGESRFTNAGRGGVPSNPTDPLTPDSLWHDFLDPDSLGFASSPRRDPASPARHQLRDRPHQDSDPSLNPPLREAQGWRVGADGTVRLVAHGPAATPPRLGDPRCLSSQEEAEL